VNEQHPVHKVVITGTGRAGTTFLVQLLSALGLDTGFENSGTLLDPNAQAGLEHNLLQPDTPYIIKSPWICDSIHFAMHAGDVVIDHAFIPMRPLRDAAASRVRVSQRAGALDSDDGKATREVLGGLWHTADPARQKDVLARQFFKLMMALARYEIPHTLLEFPRLVEDPAYTFRKLAPVLDGVEWSRFLSAFRGVAQPDLVHDFAGDETG
jgi:hypothetical protein